MRAAKEGLPATGVTIDAGLPLAQIVDAILRRCGVHSINCGRFSRLRSECRKLIRVVSPTQLADGLGIGRGARGRQPGQFLEIMLMPRRRDCHQHPRRSVADIGDIVRNARRQEKECARRGTEALLASPPFALALEHVKRLLLHSMHVPAGGKAGWDGPVEHAGVFGVLAGDEEGHWFAAQDHAGIVPGQSNDGLR